MRAVSLCVSTDLDLCVGRVAGADRVSPGAVVLVPVTGRLLQVQLQVPLGVLKLPQGQLRSGPLVQLGVLKLSARGQIKPVRGNQNSAS